MHKKTQMGIGGLSNTALTLMITGLILVFTVVVLGQFGDMDVITGDAESTYNNTVDTINAFGEWLPIVGLLAIAGIIIFLVVRAFPRTN